MTKRQLVLASGSPRRSALLAGIGLTFTVDPPDVDETPLPDERPENYVRRLSELKASAVAGEVVIAADTTVVLDGTILGKPTDEIEARSMLAALSGRSHQVLTGVTVRTACDPTPSHITTVTRTTVVFAALTTDDIDWYVASGEPMDKAGAYAIQGAGGAFVTRVDGSVTNVIGLPVAETLKMLDALGRPAASFRA